jgi:WD40 repeat protein
VQSVAFTPDGKRLLLAQSFPSDAPPTIRLLNMANGRDIGKMDSPAPYVELTGFSDDGKWFCLFRVEPTNAICVYETETFKEVWRVEDPKDVKRRLQGGQLTADRKLLFVAKPEDNAFRFFEVGTGKGVRAFAVSKWPRGWGAVFLTDGKTMVTFGDEHRHWRYWDITSGKVRREVRIAPLCSHTRVSPDGRWLLGVPEDDTLAVFEMEDGKEVMRTKLPVKRLSHAFSPDGRYFVVGTADKGFSLYRLPDAVK